MTAQGRIQPLDGGRARSMPDCGRGRHGGSVAGSQCHPAISWQRGVSSKMRLVLALLLLSLTACVPVFFSNHYLSFEDNPNLMVVEYGKERNQDALLFDSEIPLKYELVRDAYTVYFEIDGLGAYIRAKDHAGTPLSIQSLDNSHINPIKRCHYIRGPQDMLSPKRKMRMGEKAVLYSWYSKRENCSDSDSRILAFQVFDENNVLVGEEALPFYKGKNGITVIMDAL